MDKFIKFLVLGLFISIIIIMICCGSKSITYYNIDVYRDGELVLEYKEVYDIYAITNGKRIPGGQISFKDKDGNKHQINYTDEMIVKNEVDIND